MSEAVAWFALWEAAALDYAIRRALATPRERWGQA